MIYVEPKKPVIILASTFPRWLDDSTPRFVLDFAKQIRAAGYKVTAITPHFRGAKYKERLEGVETLRCRYWFSASGETLFYEGGAQAHRSISIAYAAKLAWFVMAMWWQTIITARLEKAKIINAHWLIPQGVIAILARPFTAAKVVITIHGGDVFDLDSPLFRRVKSWALKRADAVIVNSSATGAKARSLFSGRDYPIIPMGIDTDLFKPPSRRQKYDKFQILFVGRIAKEKGVIYLCQAINELVRNGNTSLRLTVVGSGPEEAKLKNYVKRHELTGQITFAGWMAHDKLPRYYGAADVLVAPSIVAEGGWQEAFGLTLAEAHACGAPVIGTDTGGISDIVTNGETGFLVAEKDPHAIAGAITKLIADLRLTDKMGERGRKKIVDNYSWQAVTRKCVAVFDRVL